MTIDTQMMRDLLSRATAGEWAQSHRSDANGMHSTEVYDAEGQTIAVCAWHPVKIDGGWMTDRAANAALIAAAKNSMAALLDIAEAAQAAWGHFNDRYRPVLKQHDEIGPYYSPAAGMMESEPMVKLGEALAALKETSNA